MAARTILAAVLLWMLPLPRHASADVLVPVISGRIFVDGRPIDRMVEIRLETHSSAVIASAFTMDYPRFTFRNVMLNMSDTFFLVIREPGFRELRQQLYSENFVQDRSNSSLAHFAGIIEIQLERLPQRDQRTASQKTGPNAVDVRQLQAKVPDEARRQLDAALENFGTGSRETALEHLERAVELAPEYYEALNRLGSEYLRLQRYREAEAVLEKASSINPNDPLPLTNLGILHFQEAEKATPAAEAKTDAGPTASESSYRKAVEKFKRALALAPLNARTSFYLGAALFKTGEYAEAESLLLKSLSMDDHLYQARLTLANVYIRQKRYDSALEQISEYLIADPDSPQRERAEDLRKQIENVMPRDPSTD